MFRDKGKTYRNIGYFNKDLKNELFWLLYRRVL